MNRGSRNQLKTSDNLKLMATRLVLLISLVLILFFASTTGYFLLPNYGVELVEDREYFSVAKELLRNARDEVLILMYSMEYFPKYREDSSTQLVEELMHAAERGVNVMVLLEKGSDELARRNWFACTKLRERGVDARLYERGNGVLHAKAMIVDEKYVLLGSSNWRHYSLDLNRELNLLLESRDLAKEAKGYFFRVWGGSRICR